MTQAGFLTIAVRCFLKIIKLLCCEENAEKINIDVMMNSKTLYFYFCVNNPCVSFRQISAANSYMLNAPFAHFGVAAL